MTTRRTVLEAVLTTGSLAALAACGAPAATSQPTPATAISTAPAAAATTAPAAVAGGSITFVLEDDVIDFDPLRSRAFVDRNVLYQIYDSLVRVDVTGKLIPWLAQSWDISGDGKSATFKLRTDVKYHDGSPFDAASVKWNIDRYRTTQGSQRSGELATVESVDVVDSATVRLTLKAAYGPLLALLVDRAGMMVSQKAVEAGGDDFTRKAFRAGTGPFMLTEAVKDDHITLVKNPAWWGKDKDGGRLPYVDKITVKPVRDSSVRLTNVKTGAAEIMNNVAGKDVAGLKTDSALTYQEKPAYSFNSLIPNRKEGFIFNEGRYVKAVSSALDRKQILDVVSAGVGAVGYGPVAPSHFAVDPNFKPFERADPEAAKRLVAEVGKGPLSFELLISSGDAVTLQLGQLIQAQLKKADIDAQLTQLEFAQILDLQSKHSFKGLTLVGWSGRVDPDGNVYDQVYTGRPNNDSSYSNPQVDKLLDDERATNDESKRKSAFQQAEKIFVVDDPARIWYCFGVAQILAVKRLGGLEVYPDRLVRFQYARLGK